MAILTATHVAQSFGALDLFSGVSVSLPNDGKAGLVGPNGVGKTTLLHILAGFASPTSGSVHVAKGTRIGFLTQESSQAFDGRYHTVYQEMLNLFAHFQKQAARLQEMEAAMARDASNDALFEEYSKLQHRFEDAGGYSYELRIQQTLAGLGFDRADWELSVAHLSGGQKTRLLLAQLLLEQPDLLILDEPTNHLDSEAIEWLEGTLKVWPGAILLVSHDRYFLDKAVNVIWEMNRDGIERYRGNYSAYVAQRAARWERKQEDFKLLKERLNKEMDYIQRNMAGQRTQMAQGKLSRLSREVEAIHAGGLDAISLLKSKGWLQTQGILSGMRRPAGTVGELRQRINEIPAPSHAPSIHMNLNACCRSGRLVLRTKKMTVGYPGTPLFESDDIELKLGDCAALIGANGTGKTTFLRAIMGEIQPLAGVLKRGASLKIGYFSQTRDALNAENTVLEELLANSAMLISEGRNYLAQFLFRGDDVHKRISALSGGERGRLSLALLALEDANFLLLDEPTNHLDIAAQEALQAAMARFTGTLLLVSHDRYLVDRMATEIWHLEDNRLHLYEGGYQAFLAAKERAKSEEKQTAVSTPIAPVFTNGSAPKLSKNEQRKRDEALQRIENEIAAAEVELERISARLQETTQASAEMNAFDKIQTLSVEYADKEEQLERLMEQWERFIHEQPDS